MPRPINPSTSHAELARTLRTVEPHRQDKRQVFVRLTPRQWDAIQEAADRADDAVSMGFDKDR